MAGGALRPLIRAVPGLLLRPRLWPGALASLVELAPRGWWRRPPFLPIPDRAWLGFRLETAYGDANAPILAADLVEFLTWRKGQRARALRALRHNAR